MMFFFCQHVKKKIHLYLNSIFSAFKLKSTSILINLFKSRLSDYTKSSSVIIIPYQSYIELTFIVLFIYFEKDIKEKKYHKKWKG